ncbi:efflux RND transporter periplasmic adaptor subunit [Seongchinamella sediminis]|uniref:Efflux RND transporter periplasmic adaptor subunit n=1 Tax=Seongchinamella sediminis TaxID=2283635 RepID=A0A3L7DTT6_9GAMM|nr:efflux RND transporter periplasmic adaptor subunit [Seongchinamella sediminis]RLQ21007.1 efflux RND transporter periplasmic adaptor subunit [Seongchinamella sediminis]
MMRIVLATVLVVTLVVACVEEAPERPLVEVVIEPVALEPYQPEREYVGRLEARDDVAIQAKVTGYLLTRDFREGDRVEAGDILYTLDASEFQAALARAEADLASAVATQVNAERNYKRGLELLPKGAISQSEMDSLTAKTLEANARLESAQAQVTSAQVNLSFTTITAPISGRIGRSLASVGDLVGPNTGNLTTLVSIDPIEALFSVSEATYVAAIKTRMTDRLDVSDLRSLEVTLELTNGAIYPEVGRIDYFSNRVDQTTGTLEARASIPNPHSLLVPGQYVRVLLHDTNLLEGLFLPQAAVQADQQGSFVLVVDAGSTVVRRNVSLGERFDDKVLVLDGVSAGDMVITRGLQQVRPGMPVSTRILTDAE